ncbi:MAG: beta-galactosidase [Bacteroidales bacterium]|nr:beta-galactosidase [Bacteroidales bacterium]
MTSLLSLLAAAAILAVSTPERMFPFQPTHAAPDNLTNVQTWTGTRRDPAGNEGFIRAEGDHFVDETGSVRRFLGTNICFSGCFPSHEDADRVAEELTRYGINLVRLHYVHHKFPKDKIYPEPDSFLEPEQLERFDYFFARLKEKGIYTYFQLNIGRKFGEQNGLPNADKLPWYNNGVDMACKRMVELHRKYVRDILGHVNPYTGLAYKDEPAIAMLEIANENSIVSTWFKSKYDFPHLTEPYASEIKAQWNRWLQRKYGSDAALRKAWTEALKGSGEEYLPDGTIGAAATPNWDLQKQASADAGLERLPATREDGLKGSHYLRLNVRNAGPFTTALQLYRTGLTFRKGEPLTLRFKIRSREGGRVEVRFSQHHDPWHVIGLKTEIECTPRWKEQVLSFIPGADDENMRLVFSHFSSGSVIDLADLSLVSGAAWQWPKGASLKKGNIDWPYLEEWSLPEQRALDFTEFLASIETDYFSTLRREIKEVAGARQCVTGTQVHYGLPLIQGRMDYVDAHSYWNHPIFPGKFWNSKSWRIRTTPLVNSASTPVPGSNLTRLAHDRVLGKPFTVSEYDHPNSNPYAAEGNLLATAFGAFQDWSAFIHFAWTHNTDYFRRVESPLFDLCSSTEKLVHFPACYAMFVRGDVQKGPDDTICSLSTSQEQGIRAVAAKQQSQPLPVVPFSSPLRNLPLAYVSGCRLEEEPGFFAPGKRTLIENDSAVPAPVRKAFAQKSVRSAGGQLLWDWSIPDAGFFQADTPRTKVFTGFVRGRSFRFEGLELTPGKTLNDWLTLSLTCTNPDAQKSPSGRLPVGKYLLAVTGVCHNSGAVYVKKGTEFISCMPQDGGSVGHAPVLCEGIEATLRLHDLCGHVRCFALDGNGDRTREVPVRADAEGNALLQLGPEYRTVWYELDIQ